jgi:single-stranded DNA-binding protein
MQSEKLSSSVSPFLRKGNPVGIMGTIKMKKPLGKEGLP